MRVNRAKDLTGRIFSIERYAIHDGEGIRTNVFLKGCPMRCLWCANPEGMRYERQLLYSHSRCIGCGECAGVCTSGAIEFNNGLFYLSRNKCINCGKCVEQCYPGALEFDSQEIKVSTVIKQVLKDVSFYRQSGNGGVTLSGGEPLYQKDFSRELLKCAKENLLHTTIETCGDYPWEALRSVIPYLDMVFYDLKHAESKIHKQITGKSNRRVINNLKKLDEYFIPIIVRVPIVPGLNDSKENIREIASIAGSLKSLKSIELLPYHQLGITKYQKLGMEYPLPGVNPPTKKHMNSMCSAIQLEGINCIWK